MKLNEIITKSRQLLECLLPIDKNRVGECQQCGRCCKLVMKCIFFRNNKCIIYKIRPPQCRKSPRTSRYLKEGCPGYSFPIRTYYATRVIALQHRGQDEQIWYDAAERKYYLVKAIEKKGFVRDNTHHNMFWYYLDDKKTVLEDINVK